MFKSGIYSLIVFNFVSNYIGGISINVSTSINIYVSYYGQTTHKNSKSLKNKNCEGQDGFMKRV